MLRQFLLHLNLSDGIGPATVSLLLRRLGITDAQQLSSERVQQFYQLDVRGWQQQLHCSPRIAEFLVQGLRNQQRLAQELALIEQYQITWQTVLDPAYPAILKRLTQPPVVLYWQGDSQILQQPALAVVGSRQADQYAAQVIQELVPPLVQAGFVIVSGGAIGADTMAHRATLQANGRTVAVLGSGLLQPYPNSNRGLFREIVAQGGVVVSPFALNCSALVGNFPARNQIIAGLSAGTIVVQAAQKSGARITAECTLNQGRELFVVPGRFGEALSAGCHELVAEGAKLIHSVQDVLNEFPQLVKAAASLDPQLSKTGANKAKLVQPKVDDVTSPGVCPLTSNSPVTGDSRVDHGLAGGRVATPAKPSLAIKTELAPATPEQLVLKLCQRPVGTDELAAQAQIELEPLLSLLFDLQLAGAITQNFAGLWCATAS